jgi:hypothetical protein
MSGVSQEQRNPYKGTPPRPWVRVQLLARNGTAFATELVVDTGNPFYLIMGSARMAQVVSRRTKPVHTNFGPMIGGWVRVVIPEVGFDDVVQSYASDVVVASVQRNSPDFEGLLGLPLLRLLEYGGDANSFWILPAGNAP